MRHLSQCSCALQDLHASSTMAALCRAAACVVQVRPLPEGPDQGRDGELYVQMKRSSGKSAESGATVMWYE